ncbi:MAG: AI-2E family transporter [Beijerinckiaceae bacterium]
MLHASLSRFAPQGFVKLDDTDAAAREVSPAEHDLILRYAILGIFVMLAIASLHLTKVISLPVTAGVVFGLVLGPVVDWMVKRGVPQHLAAALVVLTGLIFGLMALGLLTAPIAAWSDQLPAMAAALKTKLAGVSAFVKQIEETAQAINPKAAALNVTEGSPLVEIAVSSSAVAAGFLIFLFTVYFYLATRRHLKARILRLCLGQEARKSAGAFFEEIERRVATYLWVVTFVNGAIGVAAMAMAWLAGLPYPIFWGALAFLLNYLAFVGPILVAVMLFAAGLLGDSSTILSAAWPAALFYAVHLIEGNWVTPVLVGNRLTVSPFLVFLSFVFWLWLWGPIGAVLSTPLLLVAMVAQETIATYRETAREAAEEAIEEQKATAEAGLEQLRQRAV